MLRWEALEEGLCVSNSNLGTVLPFCDVIKFFSSASRNTEPSFGCSEPTVNLQIT